MGDAGIKTKSIWNRLKKGSLGLIAALPLTFGIVSKAHSQEKYEPSYTEIQTITDYNLSNEKIVFGIGEAAGKLIMPSPSDVDPTGISKGIKIFNFGKVYGEGCNQILDNSFDDLDRYMNNSRTINMPEPQINYPATNLYQLHERVNNPYSGLDTMRALNDSLIRIPATNYSPFLNAPHLPQINMPDLREPHIEPYRTPRADNFQSLDTKVTEQLQTPDLTNPLAGRYKMPEISQFPSIDAEMRNSLYKLQVEADISKSLRRDQPKMPPNQFDMSLSTWNTLQGLDTKLTKGLTPDANFGRIFTTPSDYKGLTAEIRTDNRSTTIPIAPPDYWQQQSIRAPKIEIPKIEIPNPPRIEYPSISTYSTMGYGSFGYGSGYDPFRYGSMGYDPFGRY